MGKATEPILTVTTDRQGEFLFTDVIDIEREFPEGIPEEVYGGTANALTFIGQLEGRATKFDTDFAFSLARRGKSLIWMMPPAATLHGRVIDNQGQPVAGALVNAWSSYVPATRYGVHTARTNAEGQYSIADLPKFNLVEEQRKITEQLKADPGAAALRYGPYTRPVFAKHPNFAAQSVSLLQIPGKIDFQLSPGSSIEGRIQFPEGEATDINLAGSVVRLQRALPPLKKGERPDPLAHQIEQTAVDVKGFYRFESLPAGKFHLTTEVESWVAQGVENVETTPDETATAPPIRLIRGGILRVQLLDDETGMPYRFEKPTKGFIIPRPLPQRSLFFERRNKLVVFSEEGIGETQVAAGRYRLFVSVPQADKSDLRSPEPNNSEKSPTYEVSEGEQVAISVRLRKQEKSTGFTTTISRAASPVAEETETAENTVEASSPSP